MTIRIIRLLQGYIFIIILNGNLNLLNLVTASCSVEKLNETLKAICTNQNFGEIPADLDANIAHLDLSGSTFSSLMTANSFKKYPKLKWLSLRECTFSHPDKSKNVNKDEEVFKPLEKLEHLDMSGLKQNGFPNYKWPSNIKILKVNKTEVPKKLDVSSIRMLEYVDASDTEIMSFPVLNPKAPVKTVIINNVNAMFTAEDIAPYCRITTLQMVLGPNTDLRKPVHYCDCMRLALWKTKCNIMSNNVGCIKDEKRPENCDVSDKGFLDCTTARLKCFGQIDKSFSPLLIFSVIFLIALTAITTAIAYRYARLRYHFKPVEHRADVFAGEEEEEMDEEEEEESTEPA